MNVARDSRSGKVRFGAAVYGSFLIASMVGVAFEAGQAARFMTMAAFGSVLVFWLAHWWSEVLGGQIAAGERSGAVTYGGCRWGRRFDPEVERAGAARDAKVVEVAAHWCGRSNGLSGQQYTPG